MEENNNIGSKEKEEKNNIVSEEKEETINKKENKIQGKNNFLVIALIILLIIVVLLIIYILYANRSLFSNNNTEKKENNTNVNENVSKDNDINDQYESDVKDNNNSEQQENNIETNQNSSSSTPKALDLTKSLNTTGITYQNASDIMDDYGLSMNINSDKKSITLSIDWNKFGPLSGASASSAVVEKYQITGFSKEITDTFVGDVGQDTTGITLFYLMNDGTVEYTPMFNRKYDNYNNSYYEMNYTYKYSSDGYILGQSFVTNGNLSGVSDVIKLYNIDVSNGSGYRTTIGAKADGSFFDLGNIINNK